MRSFRVANVAAEVLDESIKAVIETFWAREARSKVNKNKAIDRWLVRSVPPILARAMDDKTEVTEPNEPVQEVSYIGRGAKHTFIDLIFNNNLVVFAA